MLSGLTAGIGGLILSSRLDSGNGLFGEGDLLLAVAAVVIGGTSLFGGVGNVIGTAIGVVMTTAAPSSARSPCPRVRSHGDPPPAACT